MCAALGCCLRRPEYTYLHVACVGASLAEGLSLRARIAREAGDARRPLADLLDTPLTGPGLDGEPADWSLAAVAYMSLVDTF